MSPVFPMRRGDIKVRLRSFSKAEIILSVSLATAVLATGIISQEEEAHADSVDNTTTTTASQAQPQLVTAEQFASAKATFENNQEAQAQAQSAADSKKQTFGVCFLDT